MKLALALVLVLGCSSPSRSQGTTPSGGTAGSGSAPAPGGNAAPRAPYSCFSYTSQNSTMKRHACAHADDCVGYLDQAKNVPGLRDFTDCETVATVFCFHQAGSKEEPEGQDICQPTLVECKTGRADVVKAKLTVDSECAQL